MQSCPCGHLCGNASTAKRTCRTQPPTRHTGKACRARPFESSQPLLSTSSSQTAAGPEPWKGFAGPRPQQIGSSVRMRPSPHQAPPLRQSSGPSGRTPQRCRWQHLHLQPSMPRRCGARLFPPNWPSSSSGTFPTCSDPMTSEQQRLASSAYTHKGAPT